MINEIVLLVLSLILFLISQRWYRIASEKMDSAIDDLESANRILEKAKTERRSAIEVMNRVTALRDLIKRRN